MTSAFAHLRRKGKKKGSCPTIQELLIMETIVAFVRLVYHDAACIGLELEVADAIKFYVLHHIGKHPFDEDGAYFARVVFLAAQPLGYVPDKMPQVKGGKGGLQPDGYRYMSPVLGPHPYSIT